MRGLESPATLASALEEMFQAFSIELAGEEVTSFHQVVQRLTPRITRYLEGASRRELESFCALINAMVDAGGERRNAMATCLLEHASQVRVRKLIRPFLSAEARKELR